MDFQGRLSLVAVAVTSLALVTACGAARSSASETTATPVTLPVPSPTASTSAAPTGSPTASPTSSATAVLSTPTATPTVYAPPPPQNAITVYHLDTGQTSSVTHLRTGSDGALWFTTQNTDALGRITTAGVVTTWPLPWSGNLADFTFGGGYLWSVDVHGLGNSYIGKWSLTGTLLEEFPVPGTADAITWGPDGALWFSGSTVSGMEFSNSFVGHMTVAGVVTKYPLPDATDLAGDLMPGPDGAIWFTELPGSNVGRISTSGTITEFNVPSTENVAPIAYNQTLAAGPGGALWAVSNNEVAEVTTAGTVTVLPPFLEPASIAVTPDGDLWITVGDLLGGNNAVLEAAASGSTVADYPVDGTIDGTATVVTTGPDGMIWFGDQDAIGRLDPSIPPNS